MGLDKEKRVKYKTKEITELSKEKRVKYKTKAFTELGKEHSVKYATKEITKLDKERDVKYKTKEIAELGKVQPRTSVYSLQEVKPALCSGANSMPRSSGTLSSWKALAPSLWPSSTTTSSCEPQNSWPT